MAPSNTRRDTPSPDEIDPYSYNPSLALSIIFTAIYLILSVWHMYLSLVYARKRPIRHKYTICLFVAAVMSFVGWGMRILSIEYRHSWPMSIIWYACSQSCVVIAPVFVCASLYLLLTRLIRFNLPAEDKAQGGGGGGGGGGRSPQVFLGLSPKWLGYLFLISDFTSFNTQGGGSSIAGAGSWQGTLRTIGIDVILVGLALQVVTFTGFLAVLAMFQSRVNSMKDVSLQSGAKKVILGVWIASILVQIRTVFRLAEFAMGDHGYLMTHEWCVYVFEGGPMVIATAILALYHPVIYMQQVSHGEVNDAGVALESRLLRMGSPQSPGTY
ncbi:hypothetical protein LTR72_010031 [Exophiala xenobiotica]|nr:hypothetical protein LTR92_009640 [Exophiala xenobiotica]KAK5205829.1 hypothetical protein LTR41_008511 [Exophiala xenobiotica]KAK5217035.1 hypothetical protein LTR72_010031 [Exophiala xenobiotica]KAK5241594.1 hypothetical protein LTS06_012013 [Exophiala xenobiotica]KAK5280888.1 hypothetical protein LTR40_005713 [Exophiala xenobiotica]